MNTVESVIIKAYDDQRIALRHAHAIALRHHPQKQVKVCYTKPSRFEYCRDIRGDRNTVLSQVVV